VVSVMANTLNIAGVVLAGGRSSRMGRDKAFLDFGGKPLIDHMMELLRDVALKDVYVSGNIEGYPSIPDTQSFNGPACAIADVMAHLTGYDGVLFVPVDMPILSVGVLEALMQNKAGGYFEEWPLPAFITQPCVVENAYSVQKLLDEQGVTPLEIPAQYKAEMQNFNTPEDWKKVTQNEC